MGGAGCIFYHTVTRSRDDTRDQLASPLRTCIAQTNFSSCPIDLFVRLESSQASVHLWKFIKHNHLTVNWRDRSTNDHWKEKKTQNLSNTKRNPILTFSIPLCTFLHQRLLFVCLFLSNCAQHIPQPTLLRLRDENWISFCLGEKSAQLPPHSSVTDQEKAGLRKEVECFLNIRVHRQS